MIISPSILSADFAELGKAIKELEKADAQYLHIDVMDGMFVPSISFGMPVIKSIRKDNWLHFDVHLMIVEPNRYYEDFVEAGADTITFHLEASEDPIADIREIHSLGACAGISIKPGTPVKALEAVLPALEIRDIVLIMSVEPGFGGQSFIPESMEKLREARKLMDSMESEAFLSVDGGVNKKNIRQIRETGVNIAVAGSAVFNGDIAANMRELSKSM